MSSERVAELISTVDFSSRPITLVGFGYMGRHFLDALKALGVGRIRICTRSDHAIPEDPGKVQVVSGGFERLSQDAEPGELGIVATPTAVTVAAAERLLSLGFRDILIEKPVFYQSDVIDSLGAKAEKKGINVRCAYNRLAYPSFLEVAAQAAEEGGIRSCTYTFTEMVQADWVERFPPVELSRWGIANSLHVIGMAYGLIGMPERWKGYSSGELEWHPAGDVFVGSGITAAGIPFSYHADWRSKSRWSIEVHSALASYRLCPLERAFRKKSARGDWEELPLVVFAPGVKHGIAEQVATMLKPDLTRLVSLPTLKDAATLTRHAEDLFGYGMA